MNKFCESCGIICVKNNVICNRSTKIKNLDMWYCGECKTHLKADEDDKYYIKNIPHRP